MAGRPIGRTPPRRSPEPGDLHSRLNAKCRWCQGDVMWLQHADTGDLAPIDAYPVPGGNVLVERTAAGKYTGRYSVMNRSERGLFDATTSEPEAAPLLHMNHWATCTSSTARRLAAARSKARAGAPTVAADGTAIRRPRGATATPDRLGPPAEIAAAMLACPACSGRLHPLLVAAGERVHPSCSWPDDVRARVLADVSQAREAYHRDHPGQLTWGERYP